MTPAVVACDRLSRNKRDWSRLLFDGAVINSATRASSTEMHLSPLSKSCISTSKPVFQGFAL